MPAPPPFGRPAPVRAYVVPLPAAGDTAEASSDLWAALTGTPTKQPAAERPSRVAVAVEWAAERRLPPSAHRNPRKLVLWVRQATAEPSSTSPSDRPRLHVPAHLLPAYVPTPAEVTVHAHEPAALSLVVVQPCGSAEIGPEDLAQFYPNAPPQLNGNLDNGNGGDSDEDDDDDYDWMMDASVHFADEGSRAGAFLREGTNLGLGRGRAFRVLMCEPVLQGYVTADTRVVVAEGAAESVNEDANGGDSGSVASTHRSFVDEFDPDAFLASSLARSLGHLADDTDAPPAPPAVSMDHASDASSEVSPLTNSGSLTPRPGGVHRPPSPVAAPDDILQQPDSPSDDSGMAFQLLTAAGEGPDLPGVQHDDDVCYAGVWALGRAGVFEGDWVTIKAPAAEDGVAGRARLARVVAWERLDEEAFDLPANALLVPPPVARALFPVPAVRPEVQVMPTPFGARRPTLPTAARITLSRVATAEGVDKRYERAWFQGLKKHFGAVGADGERRQRLVRRGDIIGVPVWLGKPVAEDEDMSADDEEDDGDSDDEDSSKAVTVSASSKTSAVAYFTVTALQFEPLVPPEDDFSSSLASKARAGELGCWVDAGPGGDTALILAGVERARVAGRAADQAWYGLSPTPPPFSAVAASTLRDLIRSAFSPLALSRMFPLSVLVKGARGSGKRALVKALADELGLSVVEVPCYDIIGDTPQVTEGTLRARLDKARNCGPAVLLLSHLEAFSPPAGGGAAPPTRPPPIVKVIEDILAECRAAGAETGQPLALIGTTSAGDNVPRDMLACFKHEVALPAPNSSEREAILSVALSDTPLAPDVRVPHVAAQAAALHAGDLSSLVARAQDLALARACTGAPSAPDALLAGVALTAADLSAALGDARAAYADSIGAPKIPNVSWDDVGGLAAVKDDILDTVQLPLEHPELFGEGMKTRSGILLYGPPGTGKTLLAKAVATSCAANFLSVKGPELLNMYIGESEANVRRVFEKARDASPCVIFMDELDSVAPKRGNQGDSGGVMDRIVSQLLAELDGMSTGRGQVIVMAATNRPDLLDPALLRPGRFDRMLYLSVPETHAAQRDVLAALTRKFALHPDLSLDALAEKLPFTYTGADLYALCADAMLAAMTRVASAVDARVAELDQAVAPRAYPSPLTAQYYLSAMASEAETLVVVTEEDFVGALDRLVPSVSGEEFAHYRRVQAQFQSFEIGQK